MPKAVVVITAKNEMSKGLEPAKKSLLDLGSITEGIQKKLQKAFTIAGIATAAVTAFKTISNAAKQCVTEFTEAEKVSRRLTAVWENVGQATGKSSKQIDDLADALEKETYFTSESIKESALLLAATESLTEEGFDRALQASMDLAAALGEDVTGAAQTLAKAIQEPESALSRLKSIGVSFTEDEKAQIKALADANQEYEAQALILDKIEAKYKGVAQAVADTPSGKLDAIRDTFGDIKETLGQGIVEALDPAFTFILNMLNSIHRWARDHMDQSRFWNDASTKSSHSLYTNYSQDFISERQTEAMQDVADALEMLRSDQWGKILEENYEMALEDILLLDRNVVANQMKRDASIIFGENYEDFIGTAEGFFERVTDQYDPLVAVLENINGALEEYTSYLPEKPELIGGSGSSSSSTETKAESLLGSFLGKYGSQSESYQIRALNEAIAVAETLRDTLEGASTSEAQAMLSEAGFKGSRNSAIGQLNEIIASLNGKLDAFTALPKLLDSPTLTDLDSILASYGKQSNAYQIKQLKEEYNRIAEVFEYASDEQKVYLREILASNEKQRKELEGGVEEVVNGSFLDNITNRLASAFQSLGFGDEASSSAAGTVINTFTQNMGEAGEVVERLATNMSTMGPALGAIVTALQYVVEGFAKVISPLLNDFVKDGIEPLRELGRVIGEILMPILEAVMPLVEESGRMLMGIFNALGVIITPIAEFIGAILTPIIGRLTVMLEVLEPILKVIAGAIITVSTAFEWVAQWIKHVFAMLFNALASIEIMGWRPLEHLGMDDPGRPGSYQDMWQANWNKVNQGFEYSPTESASMSQALSQASYRGATNVTINIYATGPFVGENGMRQFASMIREEFDALDYYGVTA